MECKLCHSEMYRMYHSWYKCWVFKCPKCSHVDLIGVSEDQLTLFDGGW